MITRKTANKKLNKVKENKGFTLAELLMTVAILGIVMGIGLFGVVQYINSMKITQMDQNAKQIFIAAQNHLSNAKYSGEIKMYENGDTDYTLGSPMLEAPADKPADMDWPETDGKDKGYEFYSLNFDGGVSNSNKKLSDTIFSKMLPYGSIDDDIRTNGNYIVEYDYKTGSVYGVFYTDDTAGLTNADIKALNDSGGRAGTDEGRNIRKTYKRNGDNIIIGYYGGAMAQVANNSLDNVKFDIENKERLLVKISDPNYYKSVGGNQLKTQITVKVKGLESQVEREFILNLKDNSSSPKPDEANPDSKYWTVDKDGTTLNYTLCLDDITKEGTHFTDICADLIPGENISVSVSCTSTTVISGIITEDPKTTNSLFGDVIKDKDEFDNPLPTATAKVSAIRHLENLDSTISALPEKIKSGEGKENIEFLVTKVEQTQDLDWEKFYGGPNNKSIYTYSNNGNAKKLLDNSFFGIKNVNLVRYDGNKKTLSNFVIDMPNYNGSGLFREVSQDSLKINDVILDDCDVSGGYNTGGLVGCATTGSKNLELNRIMVLKGNVKSVGTSENSAIRNDSGGIIGNSKSAKLSIVDSVSTAIVYSNKGNAGGIIGRIENTNATIARTYASAQLKLGEYSKTEPSVTSESYSAGGLIGRIEKNNTTVINCFSTCSVSGSSHVGGFLGSYSASGTIFKNCYATGPILKGTYKGSFIGTLQGSFDTMNNCYVLVSNDFAVGSLSGNYGGKIIELNSAGLAKPDFDSDTTYGKPEIKSNNVEHRTYCYDSTLGNLGFPYPTVNATRLFEHINPNDNVTGSYYGDWQQLDTLQLKDIYPSLMESSKFMLAYGHYNPDYNTEESLNDYMINHASSHRIDSVGGNFGKYVKISLNEEKILPKNFIYSFLIDGINSGTLQKPIFQEYNFYFTDVITSNYKPGFIIDVIKISAKKETPYGDGKDNYIFSIYYGTAKVGNISGLLTIDEKTFTVSEILEKDIK